MPLVRGFDNKPLVREPQLTTTMNDPEFLSALRMTLPERRLPFVVSAPQGDNVQIPASMEFKDVRGGRLQMISFLEQDVSNQGDLCFYRKLRVYKSEKEVLGYTQEKPIGFEYLYLDSRDKVLISKHMAVSYNENATIGKNSYGGNINGFVSGDTVYAKIGREFGGLTITTFEFALFVPVDTHVVFYVKGEQPHWIAKVEFSTHEDVTVSASTNYEHIGEINLARCRRGLFILAKRD